MNSKSITIIVIGLLALVGCRATYDIDKFDGEENAYVFARPQNFVCIGTESASDWLEIVSANQECTNNGVFKVTLSLRNRGGTGFFTWFQHSHDMTIYARVDFYDREEGGKIIKSIPRQVVTLPLGDTVHFSQEVVDSRVKFARVTLLEK